MGFHWPYTKRPPANRPAAREAWDYFIREETVPHKRYKYGAAGSRGPATSDGIEPPRNRTPKAMRYLHMDYWVWLMEFTNGDFEEIDALECRNGSKGNE